MEFMFYRYSCSSAKPGQLRKTLNFCKIQNMGACSDLGLEYGGFSRACLPGGLTWGESIPRRPFPPEVVVSYMIARAGDVAQWHCRAWAAVPNAVKNMETVVPTAQPSLLRLNAGAHADMV